MLDRIYLDDLAGGPASSSPVAVTHGPFGKIDFDPERTVRASFRATSFHGMGYTMLGSLLVHVRGPHRGPEPDKHLGELCR